MTDTDVICQYISADILGDPRRVVSPQEPLISGGLIDSFSMVDLALFVEDTFGVHIEDTELASRVFDTVDELVALIHQRKN